MKPWLSTALLAFGLATADGAHAAIVYENATEDTLQSSIFSSIGATEIGDQVQLGGTARQATRASVQFFNLGSRGSFSATLNFYQTGSPVGAGLGSFVVDGIVMDQGDVLTVDFTNLNLLVPTDLIFTISLSNLTAGVDPGLNFFNVAGPTTGDSDGNLYIINDGNFSEALGSDAGNLYFVLEATDAVPEPGSLLMLTGGAAALFLLRRRM